MVYEYFNNLSIRRAPDKVFGDKVFNIAKNPKYDGYQCGYQWIDFSTKSSLVLLVKQVECIILKIKN